VGFHQLSVPSLALVGQGRLTSWIPGVGEQGQAPEPQDTDQGDAVTNLVNPTIDGYVDKDLQESYCKHGDDLELLLLGKAQVPQLPDR
jgi:hypothetical protein